MWNRFHIINSHVENLANRETAVSSSALLQPLCRNCAGWVSLLLLKHSRGTLMPHVTVTWHRRRFKSDTFSNQHTLLQVSQRSVFMALHEVEHTLYYRNVWSCGLEHVPGSVCWRHRGVLRYWVQKTSQLRSQEIRACTFQLFFTNIFNLSLSLSMVPSCFKKSTIVPIPKKNKITCLNDWRPVTLTPIFRKCFEKLIRDYICSVLPASLDPLQFAFCSNRSTDDAIAFTLLSPTWKIRTPMWECCSWTKVQHLTP